MERSSLAHFTSVLGVFVGLAILLYGEQFHQEPLVYGGGAIVILAVAIETVVIAQIPASTGH